ncbi:MAG TPA: DMT family transporter [Caldimonas sp.]|nr:DMT family transporter [Caldimonas sp.]HEX2540829.1 DMT family transporter [Caldimonas sp.]
MHRFKTWQLFAVCVLIWGTTWHAITYQLDFPAELGVALRFALGGAAVLLLCRWRGEPLRFGRRMHVALAAQGVFMYGVSYVCVYHAERFIPSGLVAVGYSAAPLLTGIAAALLFGGPLGPRFVAGGMLGIAGVGLMFWPEIVRPSSGRGAGLGVAFTVGAVLLSCLGSLVASRNRHRGMPLFPALGFGMLYGALAAGVVALALGRPLTLPSAPVWWLALVYLALAGSVLTFACFLTLQDRVGVGRAGTVGVMTPVLALAMSLLFEGYRPTVVTFAGVALALLGNTLMLLPGRTSDIELRPDARAAE